MKKHLTLFSIIFSFTCLSQIQTPNLEWAFGTGNNYTGNSDSDEGTAICTDAHGNIYTTGNFYGTADFKAGPDEVILTSNGSHDLFISKTDPAGNLKWAKSFGGASTFDHGRAIAYDDHGCIYVTGGFYGSIDFDDGPGTTHLMSGSQSDVFIQKIDTLGNVIWARSLTGSGVTYNTGFSIDVNYDSNAVFVAGYFEGDVDFDPGVGTEMQTSTGGRDFFIQKLDMAGNFQWVKTFGSSGNEIAFSVISDSSGNVYITGEFENTIDFDPGAGVFELTSSGSYDCFILKLNSAGEFVWAKSFGSVYWDATESIKLDADENIYITGYFAQTVDFDPGAGVFEMTATSIEDVFILKLNNLGEFVWARSISGGIDGDIGKSICMGPDGYIYTSGYFWGTNDFDPGPGVTEMTAAGSSDIFVQKMDSAGNFIWAISLGGTSADWGSSITLDKDQNICLTGRFGNTVDFDPWSGTLNLSSNGGSDIYVMKLNQDTIYLDIFTDPLMSDKVLLFPNPANLSTQIILPDSKNATITVYDLSGRTVSVVNTTGFSEQVKLDLSDFETGTYLVAVKTETGTRTEKLIITH